MEALLKELYPGDLGEASYESLSCFFTLDLDLSDLYAEATDEFL